MSIAGEPAVEPVAERALYAVIDGKEVAVIARLSFPALSPTGRAFRRSFSALPARKSGAAFLGTSSGSPVLGLRPCRPGRECTSNTPKPRTSTRRP